MTTSDRICIIGAGPCELPEKIVLGEGESMELVLVVLPGRDCDIPLRVELAGQGASVGISGVYICPKDEKVNISVDLVHKVPGCTSRQIFKGIAGGFARTAFYGKIVVDQDAQKTEAYQENHNLLLSDDAKVDTKPQLEIYADDVKCSHGATVGYLNEDEQFYMRSRGISLKEAKALQMISFISPVFDSVKDGDVRERLVGLVSDAIRGFVELI